MATPPTFTAGSVLTAAQMNAVGLWLVKTQALGSSNITEINVTSCFTSDFENYVVAMQGVTASAAGAFTYKLLQNTTPTTSGFYYNTLYVQTAVGGGLTNNPVSNANAAEFSSKSTTYKNNATMELQAPYASVMTRYQWMNSDDNYLRWSSGVQRTNTSYDGIQILANGGTMTGGSISVYGYRL